MFDNVIFFEDILLDKDMILGPKAVVAFLFLTFGFIHADPEEFRSNFELIGYSTNLDNPQYRILDNVRPTYMHVDLDVYLSESRFNGLVQMRVQASIFFIYKFEIFI